MRAPHPPDHNCPCLCCFIDWLEMQAKAPPYVAPVPLCYPACECGAPEHGDEPHHIALAIEDVQTHTACDCDGYYDDETGEVGHDGFCALTPWHRWVQPEIEGTVDA